VTWTSDDAPELPGPRGAGWLLVALRAVPLAPLIFGSLGLLLLVRLIERPLFGLRRPVTPWITQGVCRVAFLCLGMGYRAEGRMMRRPGIVVANHASWLDIFALNAGKRCYFVSKSDVAAWPGVGWLARATGTLFITRDRRDAATQRALFQDRLEAGHRLLFFPEGTSSDGRRVLPFKPTLFAALFGPGYRETLWVQPVSVVYDAPPGADPRIYGWWGDMDFGPHLLTTLCLRPQGRVTVVYHSPIAVADHPDRKSLAAACEAAVRAGLAARLSPPGRS